MPGDDCRSVTTLLALKRFCAKATLIMPQVAHNHLVANFIFFLLHTKSVFQFSNISTNCASLQVQSQFCVCTGLPHTGAGSLLYKHSQVRITWACTCWSFSMWALWQLEGELCKWRSSAAHLSGDSSCRYAPIHAALKKTKQFPRWYKRWNSVSALGQMDCPSNKS